MLRSPQEELPNEEDLLNDGPETEPGLEDDADVAAFLASLEEEVRSCEERTRRAGNALILRVTILEALHTNSLLCSSGFALASLMLLATLVAGRER